MVKKIDKIYPFKGRLYRQFEIAKDDDITKIMSKTKMKEKELQTAYYNEVNVNGDNGIHSDIQEKWPPDFEKKGGKIFYVPTYMALNKRRNNHEITIPKTPMRFLYKKAENENEEDEPMRNRFILFWECDGSKKFSQGNGFFYGRKSDSKPVGLGTTDGDGFLKGESLSWITDGENNSIDCTKKKKTDHVEEKVLKVKNTYDYNSKKIKADAYSSFNHHYYPGFNPLYDFGDGNFIWSRNVSRFIEYKNYAFVPLPIDIFPEKSISTIDLTTIAQDYLRITVPGIGTISNYTRKFYLPDFLRHDYTVKGDLIRKMIGKRKIYDLTFDQKDFKKLKVANPDEEIVRHFKKKHKPEPGYSLAEKNKKPYDPKKLVRQIEITEKTPPIHEESFEKLSLPEWIARINQCIKETEIIAEEYLKKAKSYTDIINQIGFVGNLSKLAAQFPYGDSNKHINNNAIAPLLKTTDLAEEIKENYVKQVMKCKTDDFKDKEFKEVDNIYEKKAMKLFNMINDEEFAKEIVYYFDRDVEGIIDKKPADWKHIINLSTDNEKKEHLFSMAVKLHKMFIDAYSVIKTTDIFDVGADNKNSAAWKAYIQVKKAYSQLAEAEQNKKTNKKVKKENPFKLEDKSPFGIVLFYTVGGSEGKKPFEDFIKAKVEDPFMQSVFAPTMLVQIFKLFGKYFATDEKFEERIKPLGDTIVSQFKKLQFRDKEKAKVVDNYQNGDYASGTLLQDEIDNNTKSSYARSINMSCSGIVFILTFMNFIDNLNSNKGDGVKQAMVFACDVLDMYDTGTDIVLGFLKVDRDAVLKGTQTVSGRKLVVSSKVLGSIGCVISASVAIREMDLATDSKARDKAAIDFLFALISLGMVFGPGGWVAALIFTGVTIAAKAIIDKIIFGGPVEQTVYNLSKDLEKGEGFILLKKDTPNYTKYKYLLELTKKYKESNKQLSWRAVGPLISMGYIVLKKNKKKREVDHEKTEELIKKIVKEYPLIQWNLNRRKSRPSPKIAKGYTIKEILDLYDNLYSKSLLLKPNEKNAKNQVMIDLNNLKNGSYDGEINGKRVQRYPLRCSEIELEGYLLNIDDPEQEGEFVSVKSPTPGHSYEFKRPQKELKISKRNGKIIIYDKFYDKVVSTTRVNGGSVIFNDTKTNANVSHP